MKDLNLNWIKLGHTGCNFASIFAKNPECVGWKRIINPLGFSIPEGCFILSLIFPDRDINFVRNWALNNGFFEEQVAEGLTGLRLKVPEGISWVQYFGPDSHVKTRQAPMPELLMCVKLPAKYYWKVGFKGILHLAHGAIDCIRSKVVDNVWDTSFKRTAKILGHKPTITEAAKTTFKNKQL
jgi:hypothetical protein